MKLTISDEKVLKTLGFQHFLAPTIGVEPTAYRLGGGLSVLSHVFRSVQKCPIFP